MDWEKDFSGSIDDREAQFVRTARLVSQLQAALIDDLEFFDHAQVFTADGSRSLSEWTAQKLDVGADTARALVRTMRRTANKPWLREALASGAVSFDRAEALSRIEGEKDLLDHLDVAGVRRAAADQVRVTAEDESRSADDMFLVMQPALDQSWWKLFGGFDGVTGAVIDRALAEKADQLPDQPDGSKGSGAWRRALALYELASGGESPKAQITVFVDAEKAVETNAETGIRLEAGPRVGGQAIQSVFCDSVTEVTVTTADGTPMRYGRKSRGIPPQLRRAILAQNHGHCWVDGCDSRYRVEVHHKTPWSQGGRTDPEHLVALCWFHHHIVVHQKGFDIYDYHGRIRFRKPEFSPSDDQPVRTGRRTQG